MKRKNFENFLSENLEDTWAGTVADRLSAVAPDIREVVACAIVPNRRVLLRSSGGNSVPEMVVSTKVSDDELRIHGGRALLAMSATERRVVLESLVPGRAWCIEAGLELIQNQAVEGYDQTNPVRAPRSKERVDSVAGWLAASINTLGRWKGKLIDTVGWGFDLADDVASLEGFVQLQAGAARTNTPEGKQILEKLIQSTTDSVAGEFSVGDLYALLYCGTAPALDAVERLLLAAQRQEGVRQTVLEAAHVTHHDAFGRLCRVVLEHDLCRFSSTVRAADVWFGLMWDSVSAKVVQNAIETTLGFLDKPKTRNAAVGNGTPQEAYFAMWAAGFESFDELKGLSTVAGVSTDAEKRFAAVQAMSRAWLDEAVPLVVSFLHDPDLRVAGRAYAGLTPRTWNVEPNSPWKKPAFAGLKHLNGRLTERKTELKAALWPWTGASLDRAAVTSTMQGLADEADAMSLMEDMSKLDSRGRARLAERLGKLPDDLLRTWPRSWPDELAEPPAVDSSALAALIGLLKDASDGVVEAAAMGLYRRALGAAGLDAFGVMMGRKNAQIRLLGVRLSDGLPDDERLAWAALLLASKTEEARVTGLDLLSKMIGQKRGGPLPQEAIERWIKGRKDLGTKERAALAALANAGQEQPTRENAFGLLDVTKLSKSMKVVSGAVLKMTPATWQCLLSVAQVIAANASRELPRKKESQYDDGPMLLGGQSFGSAEEPSGVLTLDEDKAACPVADLVSGWLASRPVGTIDADGLTLLRALMALPCFHADHAEWSVYRMRWPADVRQRVSGAAAKALAVPQNSIEYFLNWAIRFDGNRGYDKALQDGAAGHLAEAMRTGEWAMRNKFGDVERVREDDGLLADDANVYLKLIETLHRIGAIAQRPNAAVRTWELAVASRPHASEAFKQLPPEKRGQFSYRCAASLALDPGHDDLLLALAAGRATEDDVLDYCTHPYWSGEYGNIAWLDSTPRCDLWDFAGQTMNQLARQNADHKQLIEQARQLPAFVSARTRLRTRMVDLELARSEAPMASSELICQLRYAGGADVCVKCLAALGDQVLKRTGTWRNESHQAKLTHLISRTWPDKTIAADAPAEFTKLARAAKLSQDVLITLGVFTPQWVAHVAAALGAGWDGFEDAVWWIHAHTKDSEYRVDSAMWAKWQAAIKERTPLEPDELKDGAVDVAWFGRVREVLGAVKWARVYEAAKFASSGIGHKRAQLFADAMLAVKDASERELTARVKSKRHQDSIRALGLVPLMSGKAGQAQVLERYKVMQEIVRTSRKHGGSMLQASEKRAVEIGMQNLARSAGYPDPLRLQWAMERLDLADLTKGPVKAKAGDVTVTLSIDDQGGPVVTVEKKGKALAAVPPATKKVPAIAELLARVTDLHRASSRVRLALEQAMCRGDTFLASELADLLSHPVLKPMVERLVFVGDTVPSLAGYLDKKGKVLRRHDGELEPMKAADVLRLAHPHDLLARKDWHQWQRECFGSERVQPFKQVFREVYVLTKDEKSAQETKRYDGHQVQPRQTLAILGKRQWVTRAEEGVQQTFYKERITARLEFAETFYTPADVEGLTLQKMWFSKAGGCEALKLGEVPPRVFSEAMRDLDLVVSVAHRGGVDPEASQSTIEMRAALVRETAALLQLKNVKVEATRVAIKGELADYSVHMGSATVHVLPGGQVWIVPVAAEHRGRLFLPFADADPKTAEVVSKVLLLARDREIKDPSILQQIRELV